MYSNHNSFMKTLPQIQEELKMLLPNGIDITLNAIKMLLHPGTYKYNDLILLESSYRENNQSLLMGLITSENANLEFNRIRKAILLFIDELRETDLKTADNGSANKPADQYNGEVFYRIPDKMQVETEVKCIVRVAYDKVVLMEGLEKSAEDVLKDLRISDVMGVELIDPNETPHFKIRTFNEKVQRVEKDLYTEWIFYVKAITTGVFPLLLKISIIEIRDGIERKRDVVLEETVEITSTAPPQTGDTKLVPAGINFNSALLAASEGISESESGAPESPPPSTGNKAPVKKILAAFGMIALFVTVSLALYTWLSGPGGTGFKETAPTNTVEGWRDYLKKYPSGKYSNEAQSKLDSTETVIWEEAVNSNDTINIKKYLEVFPEGKYIQIARTVLEKRNVPVKEQLFYEAQLYRDSLLVLLRGGLRPYTLLFNQSGKTINSQAVQDTGTFKIPVRKFKPGNYELILQDADGSIFIDTINITPPVTINNPSDKPAAKKPVSAKPAKPKVPVTKTPPTGNTGNKPPVNEQVKPKPETPVSEPVVSMQNAYRLPAFVGCNMDKKEKEFKCTNNKLVKYLGERMKYPFEAIRKSIEGKCIVEFIVEKDGTIHEIQVVQKLGYGCDEEAIRLVSLLPPFRPGLGRNGLPIRVKYRLPVVFKIQ